MKTSLKILQTVKYFTPSKGGTETVIENIISGMFDLDKTIEFTVYCSNHLKSSDRIEFKGHNYKVVKEPTLFFFKSQPLRFIYPKLKSLIAQSDVIHHHFPFPNVELSLLFNYNLLKKKHFIITWHANIENSRWKYLSKLYYLYINIILKIANDIIVTSPQLLDNSKLLKKHIGKVKVIPLCFSGQYENFIYNRNILLEKPRNVLFVGKLRKYKGIDILLNAIKDIDAKLFIVGEGEEYANLLELANNLGISNKVFFLKGLSDNELLEVYKMSKIFVLPSISEAEAFGIVQLEAMSMGLPVINTYLNSGVPYVSLDSISGLTVEPKNVLQLKSAIESILNNQNLFETFSKNAVERSYLFTKSKMVESYHKIYKSNLE